MCKKLDTNGDGFLSHGSEAYIDGYDYLAKPVDLNTLVQVIKGYLNG